MLLTGETRTGRNAPHFLAPGEYRESLLCYFSSPITRLATNRIPLTVPGLAWVPLLTIITPSLVATTDAQGEGP